MINFLRGVYQCPGTDLGIADLAASIFGADAAAAAATDVGIGALATEAAADVALPTIAITAPAAAGIGLGDLALGAGAAGLGAAAGGALGGAGGGGPIGGEVGSPVSSGPDGLSSGDIAQAAQIGPQTLASNAPLSADAGSGILMPTTDASVSALPPDVAQSLGVGPTATGAGDPYSLTNPSPFFPDAGGPAGAPAAGGGTAPWGGDALTFDPNNPLQLPAATTPGTAAPAQPSWGSQLGKWLANPKNDITAGMLGLSAVSALSPPKLPGAAQTALGASGPAVQQAQAMIQAGGMSGPIWTQQKASIDASIDQQIAQLKQQVQQNASNMGAGGANSGLVQQQISQQVAQLEQQRQTLYAQAAEQNVQNAVAELTGGNQTLTGIAQLQYNQSQQAQQQAQKLAQLAALINQSSVPGG